MKNKELKIAHKSEELKTDKRTSEIKEDVFYQILEQLPKPEISMKLTASQRKWWYWFGYEFVKTKQVTSLDLMHLQNAAVSMDARCKLIKIINNENIKSKNGVGGWVQRFSSGATNITGYQTMYEKATKQLDDVSSHFGLSIRDRKKLGAVNEGSENQLSLFEQVAKSLHNY